MGKVGGRDGGGGGGGGGGSGNFAINGERSLVKREYMQLNQELIAESLHYDFLFVNFK